MRTRMALAILAAVPFFALSAHDCGVSIYLYWSPYALLTVIGGTSAVLAAAFPWPVARAAFRAEATPETEAFLRLGRRTVWYLACANSLIGVVALLHALDEPSAIGPSLSIALLSLLYGCFLGEGVFGTALAGRGP